MSGGTVDDDLDDLSADLVGDVLRAWREVHDRAEATYQAFDAETKAWVDEHGQEFHSLVPIMAMLQPHARQLARAMVDDAFATLDRLSQATVTVEGAVEQVIAQAKSGGAEVGGYEGRLAALEARVEQLIDLLERADALTQAVDELEEWKMSLQTSLATVSVALAPPHRSGTAE